MLTGELAERAIARARQIALAHAATPAATPADRALFWAYAAAAFDEPFANAAYSAALDDLVAAVQRGAPHLGLFGGLANAGWVLCHVLDPDDTADSLGAIDDALLGVMAGGSWSGAHDLIEGLAGFGVYFLERIAHGGGDRAVEGLARVVSQLERTATRTDAGATWHTALSILPPSFASEYPAGFYDCGIAHGVPGMIGVLARAAAHIDGARPLALEARRWLEAQRAEGTFPGKLAGPDLSAPEAARTAWCYGDPGVALGLWSASVAFGGAVTDPSELALAAMSRDVITARVVDATVCHGAAGLGHLCNRFFHASGTSAFADRARVWFARAIELPIPDEPAFLDGSAGVALALLAASTPSEPAWDRLLLSDLATSAPNDEG